MRLKNRLEKISTLVFPVLFLLANLSLLAATAAAGEEAWRRELLKERQLKDVEFKNSATSPMAGSARLTVSAGEKMVVAISSGVVSLQPLAGAGSSFAVSAREGKWFWHGASGAVSCNQGERAIAPDVDALTPGSLFKVDRFTLAAYPGPDTLALIVFDPQRPQALHFEHLLYFPPLPATR